MTTDPANVVTASAGHRGLRAAIAAVVTDDASLRQWTLIANDGIIATAGILEGFAGAGATSQATLVAGTVATVAGMLAAGGAHWAEIDSEREAQVRATADETASLAASPEEELEELVAYYEAKGLTPDLAQQVAEQLTAHNAIAAQLESEHGILDPITTTDAIVAGLGAAIAYAIGALIPLLITVFAPVAIEGWAILGAAVVSLVVTSVVGARTGRMQVGRTVGRTLAVGVGTMTISYLVGQLLF